MTAGKHGLERREVRRCNDRVPQMSNGTYPLDGWNWVSNVFSSCLKEEENKALPNSSAGSGCSLAAAAAGKEEAVTYLGSRRLECHTLALPGSDLAAQVARRRTNIAQVTCCIPSLSPPARQTCLQPASLPGHLFEFPAGGPWFGFMILSCSPPTHILIYDIAYNKVHIADTQLRESQVET